MNRSTSVAMTADVEDTLVSLLVRNDNQEDLCITTYQPSSGTTRTSALINDVIIPQPRDRQIHGNATVTAEYILRAADIARYNECGMVLVHSHPKACKWQSMSKPDHDTESSYANLVRELTGFPLVGMTLATGDLTWSARHWDIGVGRQVNCTPSTNVRVIGDRLAISWNDGICPPPPETKRQIRTVNSWGHKCQADLVRLKVLIVGAGSVGLDIAVRLAATGLCKLTIMDFDLVEIHNLDRLIGAVPRDAYLLRHKTYVARREATKAATAKGFGIEISNLSICEPDGLKLALDHDLIFSCVDRPWPRDVLNTLAYTDLIPVIDGGIAIDTLNDGTMRNATWRSHVICPQRPCMICNEQLNPSVVYLDKQGQLDNPRYISRAEVITESPNQNVATLSINVAASLLSQFISLTVAPAGLGDPGPLQYTFSSHYLEKCIYQTKPHCDIERKRSTGNKYIKLTGRHERAEQKRQMSNSVSSRIKFLRFVDDLLFAVSKRLDGISDKGS